MLVTKRLYDFLCICKMTNLSHRSGAASPNRHLQNVRVAPVFLHPVVKTLRKVGADPDPLCAGLGFSIDDLEAPGITVSHREATSFLRRALPLIDSPCLGIELGRQTNILNRGALALGLMGSETLGDAIALKLKFPASAGLLLAVEMQSVGERHSLVADSMLGNHDLLPFLVDKLFAGFVRLGRQVAEGYAPSSVEFVRPKPAGSHAYDEHFRCPVKFSCTRNRLNSSAKWLKTPLPTANVMALRLATELLQRKAQPAEESGIGFAVGRAIRRALPVVPQLAEVASALHMSERTLRRRLAEEGLSYQALLDETRKDRALELLMHTETSLSGVAEETGFSDLRTFRRAFKQWTGLTPSQVRTPT